MVEFALAAVLLALLISGIVQYGALFGSTIDISAAARDAARAGSQTTTAPARDSQILAVVLGRQSTPASSIEKVVIYRAANGTTGPPPSCVDNDVSDDACQIYTASDLAGGANAAVRRDGAQNWPEDIRQAGSDYLGVWVKVKAPRLSTMVWSPAKFSDYFVMKMDPIGEPTQPSTPSSWGTGTHTSIPYQPWLSCTNTDKPACANAADEPSGPGGLGGSS